jgi:hypothetical protein
MRIVFLNRIEKHFRHRLLDSQSLVSSWFSVNAAACTIDRINLRYNRIFICMVIEILIKYILVKNNNSTVQYCLYACYLFWIVLLLLAIREQILSEKLIKSNWRKKTQ